MLVSRFLHDFSPGVWHWLKYQQYLHTSAGEREIKYIGQLIPPDKLVIDVGVHLGFYSRHFARFAAQVLSFEANPASAKETARMLPANVTIENVALSDENTTVQLRVPIEGASGGEAALGTLAPSNNLSGAAFRSVPITARRLDGMGLPPIGLVKIDVEGHEEAVLRGARGILERDRPNLMIEIEERHNAGSIPRVFHGLAELGYRGFVLEGDQLSPISADMAVASQQTGSGRRYINNFFFLQRDT
jgi:FkbM family methyltransferase